ncbi:Golgi membrane exchange factor (Ric1p-Rgp1p) subunit [Malassezia vespertilionis]|uniref:Rgp1p n=1 Tax=Malassezia vespertilionis TaxID=2020962 RepID=A0A2N1JCK1_9BASI|nr:Golgi membrane exchange factor (Ric1p-Rgp1p) subunit [Malassezia vespertilionis]PKI84274.1 hypothetical protein MVES_001526 [Malassezia vespertilionis]WFD06279.1 Golgi membrane exchange factor (Ric1p-Rgp1p) subunit [Malassezia vespertilionis]
MDLEPRSALVVAVTPTEPSCFAGELFECEIRFTNTNKPQSAARHAPPAMRRSVSQAASSPAHEPKGTRLGLVGMESTSKHGAAALGRGQPPRRGHQHKFSSRSEAWAKPNETPQRSDLAVHGTHPHARQKSIVEHQVEDLSRSFGLMHAAERPPSPLETASPRVDTFAIGQAAGVDATLRESLTTWTREQNTTQTSPLFPDAGVIPHGYEKLIWAFAQFGGTMELDHHLVRSADFEALRLRLARGEVGANTPQDPGTPSSADRTPRVVGGGELDFDTEIEAGSIEIETGASASDMRASHTPSVAALAALLFRYTAPSGTSRALHTPRHMRTGSTLSDIRNRTLLSKTLPTYSTPPTILGTDLLLAPGESKTFTFRMRLPPDLPPSFHGHAVHFDYYVTVGTNRIDTNAARSPARQQSRLLHIPIRVYNHVTPSGADTCFDLLNPIVSAVPHATVASNKADAGGDRDEIVTLLEMLRAGDAASATTLRGDVATFSCMDAANELTRTAGKVSYDIAKDGHIAAVLMLGRARYRLGDSVQALLRMNLPDTHVRIVRLTAALESCEEVDPSLATLPSARVQRHTRQVYATHHESTLDTRQTSFVLMIPSGATPAFSTSGIQHRWSLRVSLLTATCTRLEDGTRVGVPMPPHLVGAQDAYAAFHTSYHGVTTLSGVQTEGGVETEARLDIVECSVPVSVLPNSAKTKTVPIELYA